MLYRQQSILSFIQFVFIILISCNSKGQQKLESDKKSGNYPQAKILKKDSLSPTAYDQKSIKFYKDKNHVYSDRLTIIEGVDPQSFEILSNDLIKDKNYVYYEDYPSGFIKNEKIDASTVEYFGEKEGYEILKDKNNVYVFYNESFDIVKDADAKTFKMIYHNVYADDNHLFNFEGWSISKFSTSTKKKKFNEDDEMVYVEGNIGNIYTIDILRGKMKHLKYDIFSDGIEIFSLKSFDVFKNADPSSFTIINEVYTKDKNNVYKYGEKLGGLDAKTFKILYYSPLGSFYKDKNGVYWDEIRITDIDIATLQILSMGYIKDINNVYFHSYKMPNADAKSFRVLNDARGIPSIAIDKDYVFWTTKILKEVSPNNINIVIDLYEWLNDDYWFAIIYNDGKGDYELLKCNRIKASNLPTGEYYILKEQVYYSGGYCEGKEIEGADWKSFQVLNQKYTKDKKYVYYEGKSISNLDPKSMQLFGGNHGKDKHYYFRNGRVYSSKSRKTKKFDFATFQSIGNSWGFYKDKNHVYDDDLKIIEGVDPKTIEPIYLERKN